MLHELLFASRLVRFFCELKKIEWRVFISLLIYASVSIGELDGDTLTSCVLALGGLRFLKFKGRRLP